MAKSGKRPLAVFNIAKYRRIGDFIIKVIGLVLNITNNPLVFVTPKPTVLVMNGHLDDLNDAEAAVQSRAPGTVGARDEKYDQVLDDVHALQNYVQDLADASPDEQSAITIITTAGFDVKVNGVRLKPALAAKNTDVSGSVKLMAKSAGQRVSYNWQKSTDNAVTWLDLPSTMQAKTMVTGLTAGSTVSFRVRTVEKEGTKNWGQPVSIMVT